MGVAPRWRDIEGREHETGIETQVALLGAMGVEAESEADAERALAERQAGGEARRAPPEIVANSGRSVEFPVEGPWRLECEDGAIDEGVADGTLRLSPPDGVHALTAGGAEHLVIVAPPRAPSVAELTGRPRVWGAMAPLWGLMSARTMAVGDYADLAVAATQLGALGADFTGINPVHALGAAHGGVSPYGPTSRIAYATGHIAPDAAPGFSASPRARRALSDFGAEISRANKGSLAQWEARETIVGPALQALYEDTAADDADFAEWSRGRGADLSGFALFEALSLRLGADWRRWPADFGSADAPGAQGLAVEAPDEPRFHLWLQYLADRQIAAAQAASRASGQTMGLYLDVAVGVRPDGADVWAEPEAFAHGVSLGAPPDKLAPNGQNWSLAPFSPEGLRHTRYGPFRAALRAAMRHAGIIRVDHILGFGRAYWTPETGEPGGYVAYPFDALLALTRLEASRARCAVIGEDLGTVPEGFRDKLAESRLYGCAVMQFERHDGEFDPPRNWREEVSASFGTHDTPTIRGWLRGRDIEWRQTVGHYDEKQAAAARKARDEEIEAFDRMLRAEGFSPDDEDATASAAHAALADSPAAIAAVSLDDAFGAVEQQNLPGTVDSHPNWRRRLPVRIEEFAERADLASLAETFSAARPKGDDDDRPGRDRDR